MNKELLKLALCAVMTALPLGAWADVVNKTWDFTNWSTATIANLDAVAVTDTPTKENKPAWKKTTAGEKGYYDYYAASDDAAITAEVLKTNGTNISETDGLTFYIPKSDKARLRIDNRTGYNRLYFISANEKFNIALSAGKKVTIDFQSESDNITMTSNNANVVAYNQAAASNTRRQDVFIATSALTASTSVSFGQSSNTKGVYIYSITVEDATAEELALANGTALFGTDDFVYTTTLWTFDQYVGNGEIISKNTVVNFNGLYMYGHNSDDNCMKTAKQNGKQDVEDFGGQKLSYYNTMKSAGNEITGKAKASTIDNRTIAFNAAVPGTVYIYAKVNSVERYMEIGFNTGDLKVKTAGTNAFALYSYTSTEPGCFTIGATTSYEIAAVKFVPTTAIETTKTITMNSMGLMTFSDIHAWTLPDGLNAYTVGVTKTGNKLKTTKISSGSTIPACTGVILEGDKNAEYTLTLSDADATARDINFSLRPVTIDYALPKTYSIGENPNQNWDNYILAKSGDDVVLAPSSGEGNITAGKAYFSIRRDQATPAAGAGEGYLYIDFNSAEEEAETTGVNIVENSNSVIDGYYNLAGQRVAQPTKGLYIVNGKKVIIK